MPFKIKGERSAVNASGSKCNVQSANCHKRALDEVLCCFILSILLYPFILFPSPASAQDIPTPAPQIEVVPTDSFNLKIVDRVDDHYIVVQPDPPVHNWFAATFKNLPTDAPVTIGIRMSGVVTSLSDGTKIKADVAKWVGLVPVMTYGDPTKYECYECYEKKIQPGHEQEGEGWWCDDPLLDPHDCYGGNKDVPEQRGVPQGLATQFLLKDGKHWEPWREVDKAEALPGVQVFRITQTFAQSTATVAMRVPYTYAYEQQVIVKLKAAKLPGVAIDDIGTTSNGRKLQVIRISPPGDELRIERRTVLRGNPAWEAPEYTVQPVDAAAPAKVRPLVLVSGAEYATEHASSWVVQGLLSELLQDTPDARTARAAATYLMIPVEDPDGNVQSNYSRLPGTFFGGTLNGAYLPNETLMYVYYLQGLVASDRPLLVSTAWDSLVCNEGVNIRSPLCMCDEGPDTTAFNTALFTQLQREGLSVGVFKPLDEHNDPARLFGWCEESFSTLGLLFEVNDRYPKTRLYVAQLQSIGSTYSTELCNYLTTPAGIARREKVVALLSKMEKKSVSVAAQRVHLVVEYPRINDVFDNWYLQSDKP